MERHSAKPDHAAGFTLIEILVMLVIAAVLLTAGIINLGQPEQVANASSAVDTLLADIKSQQNQAMAGGTSGLGSAQTYGIYLQSGQYTLFAGSSYSAGNSTNYVVAAPTGTTLSTTFPSTQVIFTKGAGEIQGFVSGSNTITVSNKGVTKTITVDRFGALSVN